MERITRKSPKGIDQRGVGKGNGNMSMENNRVEYLSEDAWRQWHIELLQSTVNRVYERVPFYKRALDKAGIRPEEIESMEDLKALPFTSRMELASNYPYGFFAVPLRDIVRIHSLGTSASANPIVLGYTLQDLSNRKSLTRRFLATCGVTPEDIVQICLDPGMAIPGQDFKEGAETLGALVIPPDPLSTRTRLQIMMDFKTSVLITTPSYAQHLMGRLFQNGLSLASLSLKRLILVGETLKEETRREIEQKLELETRAGYGISEITGPGLAYECQCRCGLHLSLDHVIPEVIDPYSGQQLGPGHWGELVLTTVTNRSNPLIRFRTGDITKLDMEPCVCGRTTWRMAPVKGRTDGLLAIRGVLIDPAGTGDLIARWAGGKRLPFLMVLSDKDHLTRLELWIAIDEEIFSGSLPQLHNWIREMESAFKEATGISCRIKPVEIRTIVPYLKDTPPILRYNTNTGELSPLAPPSSALPPSRP